MTGRALVTGATGMLGSYVAERLVAEGWSVRALVRDPGRACSLEARGVRLAKGDLADPPSLVRAAGGCDLIVHAAAGIGAGSGASFARTNVDGTANVVAAAVAAGARLVHVSSTAVHGGARYRAEPTDETAPLPTLPADDAYGRSKQAAEGVVLEACRSGRLWGSVVRPPLMYGLRDRQFVPRVAPVFERGLFPLIAGGRTTLTLVHAGNVAEGALLAGIRDEAAGRVYLLTDDFPLTAADLVRYAAVGLGRRILAPDVPRWAGRAGFAALGLGLRVTGRGELVRHADGTLAMLTRDNPFTTARARSELGWAPGTTPQVGVVEAFGWWAGHVRTADAGTA